MKSLILMLIYTATFMGMFLVLSSIGMLWNQNYRDILSDHTWFMIYTLFFGWWLALFPTREYYMHNQEYFNEYL